MVMINNPLYLQYRFNATPDGATEYVLRKETRVQSKCPVPLLLRVLSLLLLLWLNGGWLTSIEKLYRHLLNERDADRFVGRQLILLKRSICKSLSMLPVCMKTFQRCDQITSGYHTGMIIYMTNVILINSAVYIKSFYCSLNPDNVWPVSDCFHPSVIMNNFSPRCNINRGFGTTLTRQQNLLYLSIALHIDNPLFSWSQHPLLLFGLVLMIRFTATLSEEMDQKILATFNNEASSRN